MDRTPGSTRQVQPWRAFWPIRKAAIPPDQHHQSSDDDREDRPLTWYKSERGQLEDEQKKALSVAIADKYADQVWYAGNTASVDDIVELDRRCPYCGKDRCTCATFEGG